LKKVLPLIALIFLLISLPCQAQHRLNSLQRGQILGAGEPLRSPTQGGAVTAASVPTLVQHVDINQAEFGTNTVSARTVKFPNTIGTGNYVIVSIFCADGGSVSSVTDDGTTGGNSYSQILSKDETTGHYIVYVYGANITKSARVITVNFSSGSYTAIKASEFYNVATSSSVDTFNSAVVTGTTLTAGAITPAVSGDLLYMVGFQDTTIASHGPALSEVYTAGTGQSGIAWSLAPGSTNSYDGSYAQYGRYNSTATFTPQLTVNTSKRHISAVIALKSASAGTAPGVGIRVVAAQHCFLGSATSATMQFVTAGNLQILLSTSQSTTATAASITGITSTGANTTAWTPRVSALHTSGSNYFWPQILDSYNASAGSNTLTISISSGGAIANDVVLLDVSGASATPWDVTDSLWDHNELSGSTLTTDTITPSTANGLIVTVCSIDNQTLIDLSAGNSLTSVETAVYTPSPSDENNGFGILYNSSASASTFVWSQSAAVVNYWGSVAASYKAASASSSGVYIAQINPPYGTGTSGIGNVINSSGAVTRAFQSPVTSGNRIIVTGAMYTSSAVDFVAGNCTKSAGTATIGTVTLDKYYNHATSGYIGVGIWSAPVTGSGTLTMQVNNASSQGTIIGLSEFIGLASGVDGTGSTAGGTSSGTEVSGTFNTSAAGVVIASVSQDANGVPALTPSTNYSNFFAQLSGVAGLNGGAEYWITPNAETGITAGWSAPTTDGFALCAVGYK
jgi:hypothetical protein